MKQSQALDILKTGRNVYLTGAAGSGKTHVLNEYIEYLKHRGVRVGVTASTGIAATHIGGVTIHSWSGVGIKDTLSEREIEALEQKEYLWKRFNKTRVLVIDEVSMLHPRMFDTVERVCRALKRNDEPFGGMQIILSGDFFQLPPISRGGGEVKFINTSEAWRKMDARVCYLSEQFRHKDNDLESVLQEMRTGNVSGFARDKIKAHKNKKFSNKITPTRLYTHNVDVDTLNDQELDNLSGKERVFEMSAKGRSSLVGSLKKSVLAPETLRLKNNAIVMFVKNNFDMGYVNGTLGIVEGFDNGLPIVKTLSGDKIAVSRAKWEIVDDGKILASVEQLPLRLAWAITIHKSQGMSMDAAEIDLSKTFVPGQGYVALSRLRSLEGLSLLGINDLAFVVQPQALRINKQFLADSLQWEQAISKFSNDRLFKMHNEFIVKNGGTLNKKEIEKNKKKKASKSENKIPTHMQTKALVDKKLSLQEMAAERGMVTGTIISHLEKLKELKEDIDFSAFKPKEMDLKKIKEAFKTTKDFKLTAVYRKLGGKYSYEDIRLAKLFL